MELILSKAVTLWPSRRRLVVVGGHYKYTALPIFGFHENCGRSYFVAGCGGFYMALRLVSLSDTD